MTVKAVDLHLLNPDVGEIHVGDKVHVTSSPHGLIDELTCTRIEYDMQNAGNSVYTFGNPKQTLTQRYRKDIQKTQSAATGSGGGGGGGGAAAAGAAAEEAASKANAWCTILKEEAFASIGASNEGIDDMKNTLTTECGIDSDGNTGNINIESLKTVVDKQGNTISTQGAHINLLQEETESRIELVASRVTNVEELEAGHHAELVLRADDLESEISVKADKVTVNALEVNIDSKITNLNSEITNVRNLVAQEVNALKSNLTWLNSATIRVSQLNANKIDATNIEANFLNCLSGLSIQGQGVATVQWVKDQGYLTEVPSNCKVSTLTASSNIYIGGAQVATKSWVYETLASYALKTHKHDWDSITGKPSTFTPSSHRHSFSGSTSISIGHTHYVSAVGKNTGGMSTNYSKSISISGSTGYN